ncbi:hypothetical protein GGI43DRAFT_410884 [Trichoderma evansii]
MYTLQSAEPYCILCRRTMPTLRDFHVEAVPREYMPWETAVLGLVDIRDSPSGAPRIFTFKANLNRKQYGRRGMFCSFQPTFNLISRKGKRGKKIQKKLNVLAFYPPGHRLVFFIHRTCWKLAQTLRPKLSGADLYDFALKLREATPRYCWEASDPWQLVSFSNGNAIGNLDLESWLSKCAQLPIELQWRILSHVHTGDKLTFSLLAAVKTLSLLDVFSSALPPHGPSVESLIPDSDTAMVHLYASFIQLFGLNYIHHVRIFDKPLVHDDWNHQHIEVNISMICKIEFIVGLMGILAVRFYFRDGSNSSWLGSARKGWRYGPLDIHPQDIAILNSDHRNIFEELAKFLHRHLKLDMHSKDLPFQPFWDITQDLPKSGESFMVVSDSQFLSDRQFYSKLKYFPVQAMCKYLPFRENGCYIKGMTVYTSRQGTSGIVLHWKGSDLAVPSSQQRQGTPTSFYFLEGEEIITASLVVYNCNLSPIGPYLMFKTNLERFAYFGPRLRLSDPSARYISLIPDRLEQRCAIMGLIVDQNGVSNGNFTNIGVHCQPREDSNTTEAMVSSPKLQFSLPTQKKEFIRGLFGYTREDTNITTANLTNIKQLRVQRRPFDELAPTGLRCTGLSIHHTDESIETLGSWDGSSTTPSEIIYDSETDGHLKRLIFHLTIDRTHQQYSTPYAYYMCSIVAVSTIGGFAKEPKELQESEEHQELLWGRSIVTEQIFNYEISSDKPPFAWCFDDNIDIIEPRSTGMEDFRLERYGTTPSDRSRSELHRVELRREQ